MELNELHIHELRARTVGKRQAVSRILPTIAGNLVSAADAARSQNHSLGPIKPESSSFAVVPESSHHAIAVLKQGKDDAFHIDINPLVDPMVLQSSDHLEPGPVSHVGQARVFVAAEVTLKDSAFFRTIENGSPSF
jgi:hypothetical protein